jgi:uncharacterized protein YdiU (UPF0061 family)
MRLGRFKIILIAALLALPRFAGADAWNDSSNGSSSFLSLGPAFSVRVPVRSLADQSRVVLLQEELARQLGLTGADVDDIAKQILERFAVTSEGAGGSRRTLFATRYQDYDSDQLEKLGNPQGDGRAAWSGEIEIKRPNGQIIYLDVSVKGLGRTPLSRAHQSAEAIKSSDQYSDGLQTMEEAIRSYVISNALDRNGLETVRDLAVIEIPLEKVDHRNGKPAKAALTIRVGPQVRTAHFKYFKEQGTPEQSQKLLEYTVRRELGLRLDAPVSEAQIQRYLSRYAANLGREGAYYTDLNFVHGSPTPGNQTVHGSPVDFGTFMVMDAQHGEMDYLYGRRHVKGQISDLASYVYNLARYLPGSRTQQVQGLINKNFLGEYENTLTRLWLNRLGLGDKEMALLSPERKESFLKATKDLLQSEGKSVKRFYAGEITPAAFDLRSILHDSLRISLLPEDQQATEWQKVFLTRRRWSTLFSDDLKQGPYSVLMKNYTYTVNKLVSDLKEQGVDFAPLLDTAKKIGNTVRAEDVFPNIVTLMQSVRDPKNSLSQNNRVAEGIIRSISDRDEPFSGWFPPKSCVVRSMDEKLAPASR